jgi:glycosyltransferase involved in cell wall biosynthesis
MLSIIIPAHNEQDYIEETLKSIKSDNFKDYEIIVVCDDCTDKTIKISKKYTKKVIPTKQNYGPGLAKNKGVEFAKGNKLIFLDADTRITPNTLNAINKTLDLYPDIVGTCRIKPTNNIFKHKIFYTLKNKLLCPFGVSNGIIFCTKNIFKKYGGFPHIKKGEDGMFLRKIKRDNGFIMLNNYVLSSTRRYDKKGYIRIWFYWLKEKLIPSDDEYEPIR